MMRPRERFYVREDGPYRWSICDRRDQDAAGYNRDVGIIFADPKEAHLRCNGLNIDWRRSPEAAGATRTAHGLPRP